MPAISIAALTKLSKSPQIVFLATWKRQHSQIISLHTTMEGAHKYCCAQARSTIKKWDPNLKISDSKLFDKWNEITEGVESFEITSETLHGPKNWAKSHKIKGFDNWETPPDFDFFETHREDN